MPRGRGDGVFPEGRQRLAARWERGHFGRFQPRIDAILLLFRYRRLLLHKQTPMAQEAIDLAP
jgi:hypothetical protein